jgi:hypothetical protein
VAGSKEFFGQAAYEKQEANAAGLGNREFRFLGAVSEACGATFCPVSRSLRAGHWGKSRNIRNFIWERRDNAD